MYKLRVFHPNFSEPSASPFCVKAMCLLTVAGVDFENLVDADPRKAPKKKFPVLEGGDAVVADSEAIQHYVEEKYGFDFNVGLSVEQKALSHAVVRMTEEHLYFTLLAERWMNEESWAQIRRDYFDDMPKLLRGVIAKSIRKQVVGQAMGQGIGRHSSQERADKARADLVAIKEILGDKPFLFGSKPTLADISLVPVLASLAILPVEVDIKHAVTKDAGLMAYIKRGQDAFYPK